MSRVSLRLLRIVVAVAFSSGAHLLSLKVFPQFPACGAVNSLQEFFIQHNLHGFQYVDSIPQYIPHPLASCNFFRNWGIESRAGKNANF